MLVSIEQSAKSGWTVRLSAEADGFRLLLDAFKRAITPTWRRYDPHSKVWKVSVLAAAELEVFVQRAELHGVEVIWRTLNARRRAHFATLHLLPSAPAAVVSAAYKALARLHHPDRGGDHNAMLRINRAYEELENCSTR